MNLEKILMLGIFLALRLLLCGSWSAENVIIRLLIFGLNIKVLRKCDSNRLDNLTRAFRSLAADFKTLRE